MKSFVLFFLAIIFQLAAPSLRAATDPALPAPAVVTVTASRSSTAEGDLEPALFTIKRTGSLDTALLVFYRVGGTAAAGSDFETLPGAISIPARSSSIDVRVRAIDDKLAEQDETVTLTLIPPIRPLTVEEQANSPLLLNYVIGDPPSATVTIKDNDRAGLPMVSFEPTDGIASESGPHSGQFTVSRNGSNAASLTVEYQIVLDPLNGAPGVPPDNNVNSIVKPAINGVDYKELSGSVTFPAGASLVRISIDPIDDTLYEGTEYVTLRLQPSTRYYVGTRGTATVLIADNDPISRPPAVTIVASVPETPESDPTKSGAFKVTRTGSTSTKLNVHYTISGTAQNGVDYSELPRVVTIPAGDASAAIPVKPVPDKALEGNETVILTLDQLVFIQPPGPEDDYTVGDPRSARVTIVETPGIPQSPKAEITKPASGTTFPEHSTVDIEGVATDSDGYITGVELFVNEVHQDGLVLILPPEAPGRSRVEFKFQWKDVRAGEYVLVVKATDNSGLSTRSEPVKVFVRAVNERPVVTIVATDAEAFEHDPQNTGTFVVSRTGSVDGALFVFYIVDGTAKAGGDYEKLSGGVEIPKGEKSARIVVRALADNVAEEKETVIVRLITPPVAVVAPINILPSYVVGDPSSATVFIIDGDSHSLVPKVAIDSPKNGDAFNENTTIKVEVEAADADGYITKAELYANDHLIGTESRQYLVRPPNGQVARFTFEWKTVPAGEYALVAKATDDSGQVGASAPVKITVRGLTQLPLITITAPDAEASESDPANIGVFSLRRTGPTTTKLNVYYSITGTAENGVDYKTLPRFVTIPEGQEGVRLEVVAIADQKREGRETVTLTLLELLAVDPALGQLYRTSEPRSATVVILDSEDSEPVPFVRRTLPDIYTPGVTLKVVLEASPGANVQVYALEDHPPRGWKVGNVSNEGIYDSANNKVKFGPFFDGRPRTLTYEVTPPADESGPEEFSGIASANGHDSRVGGDQVITNGRLHHPADKDAADFAVRIGELTAYAFAWKNGQQWPIPPNPIPQSYVTRAAEIWRKGETYHFDPAAGPAPLWWVPGPAIGLNSINEVPIGEAPLLEEARAVLGRVTRVFTPRDSEPGSYLVLLTVMPKSGVSAYTVEEHLPEGWLASDVDEEGKLDSANGTIRWGLFLDDQSRTLKYHVKPPGRDVERVTFSGAASFDGIDVQIHTQQRPNPGEGRRSGLLEHVRRHDTGELEVVFNGEIGRRYRIQVSANLIDWEDLGAVVTDNGEIEVMDAKAAEMSARYYRTVLDE